MFERVSVTYFFVVRYLLVLLCFVRSISLSLSLSLSLAPIFGRNYNMCMYCTSVKVQMRVCVVLIVGYSYSCEGQGALARSDMGADSLPTPHRRKPYIQTPSRTEKQKQTRDPKP